MKPGIRGDQRIWLSQTKLPLTAMKKRTNAGLSPIGSRLFCGADLSCKSSYLMPHIP